MNDSAVLHRYLDAWELSCPRTIAQTRTSQVYTVRYGAETVVLKLMSTSEAKERRGALSLRFFDGHGGQPPDKAASDEMAGEPAE